jgi:hypothetical protein
MKITRLGFLAALSLMVSSLVSCESIESGPKPTGERLSSMPHNIPAPWEGQAGMPGMMSGQY